MQIDTSALAALKSFNDFAAVSGANRSDIARLGASRDGSGPTIAKGTGDKAYALTRSEASKIENNKVRAAFKDAVSSLFGGFDKIPKSVKDVMKLGDYGKGRPLTARRIEAVKTAVVQALGNAGTLQDADGFAIGKDEVMLDLGVGAREELTPKQANEKLREAFSSHEPISQSGLPRAITKEIQSIFNDIDTRFFGAPSANERSPQDFGGPGVSFALTALVKAADAEGRRVTVDEVVAALKPVYERGAVAECLKGVLADISKEVGLGKAVNVHTIRKRHPEMIDDLVRSTSPDDLRSRIENYKETIRDSVRLIGEIRKHEQGFVSMVEDAVSRGLGGVKVKFEKPQSIPFKFGLFTKSILENENADAKKPGWNLQDAVKLQAEKLAKGFIDRCNEVDKCAENGEISADLAKRWKAEILVNDDSKALLAEKIVAGAKKLDAQEIVDALKPENDARTALKALGNFAAKLEDVGVEMLGGGSGWRDAGFDGRRPIKMHIMEVLIEKTPGLKEALLSRREELAANIEDVLAVKKPGGATLRGPDYDLAEVLFKDYGFDHVDYRGDGSVK